MERIRLNKFISDSGYCSRREADTYIEQGRVTVNLRDMTEKGAMINAGDKVEVDGEKIKQSSNKIYIALNKPSGVTSTTDRDDRSNIIDFVGHKERIFPIGRLDKLSQGLILMTNDGDIVNKILRAGNAHEKEYIVMVDKPITDDFLKKMSSGVRIEMGVHTLPCKVTRESELRFRIILKQGLNRQIRRMCEVLHYEVKRLQRVRIMGITIRGIAEGTWRYLTPSEMEALNATIDSSDGTEVASRVSRVRSPKPMTPTQIAEQALSDTPARDSYGRGPHEGVYQGANKATPRKSGMPRAARGVTKDGVKVNENGNPPRASNRNKAASAFDSYRKTGRSKSYQKKR